MPDENYHQDPWELLHQELPFVRVSYRWLQPDVAGYTEWPDGGPPHIVLAEGAGPQERRVTLAHEAHHVLRGAPEPTLVEAEEEEVRRLTARWLLPDVERMGHVLRRYGLRRTARKLQVTPDVVLDRIRWSTQDELDVLADWQPHYEQAAG